MLIPNSTKTLCGVGIRTILLSMFIGCNGNGTAVDDTADTADTADTEAPDCVVSAPFEEVQIAVADSCSDNWECIEDEQGDRHSFLSACFRERFAIVKDCHRADDLLACADARGDCAKSESEACARAFTACEN